jgi:Transposase IS4
MARSKSKKKQPGVGAKASCFARLIRPNTVVRELLNHNNKAKLDDLIIVGETVRVCRTKGAPVEAFLFRHDRYPDQELYAAKKNTVITAEGHPDHFFDAVVATPTNEEELQQQEEQIQQRIGGEQDQNNFQAASTTAHGNLTAQAMHELQEQGIMVDDDNEPVPENNAAPVPVPVQQGQTVPAVNWNIPASCTRRMIGAGYSKARFKNVDSSVVSKMTDLSLFQLLFPMEYVESVIIAETSKKLKQGPLTKNEFFVWIGLWFYMGCHMGFRRRDWWAQTEPNINHGAPFRFNEYMSRNRFEDILQNLVYTNRTPPAGYVDRFFQMRQMEEAWNKNMADQFDPSWINCLDESMMEWLNQFTCPGFMCVGRKPHPFGNERHTICCALSTIMWHAEIVEGKDRSSQMGQKEFNDLGGPTVGLMVRMTKPIHYTSKVVVMDSGFCVAKGIIEMEKKGIYGQALIKKRRYWPKFIPGDKIDQKFQDKEVGETGVGEVKVDTGEALKVFCFKEPDYVMKIMASFGTLEENKEHPTSRVYKKDGQTVTKKFNYIEPMSNHFKYRHQIDDHNNRRHSPISIEKIWATKFWPDRNFAWFLAVTEVNTNLARGYFGGGETLSQLDFRKKLALEMMNSAMTTATVGEGDSSPRNLRLRKRKHDLISLKRFEGGWCAETKKFRRVKSPYQQQRCKNWKVCKKQVRAYCRCSPGLFLCIGCFAEHTTSND